MGIGFGGAPLFGSFLAVILGRWRAFGWGVHFEWVERSIEMFRVEGILEIRFSVTLSGRNMIRGFEKLK